MKTKQNSQEKYDGYYTGESEEQGILGRKSKAQNIVAICREHKFNSALDIRSGDGSVLHFLGEYSFCGNIKSLEISKSGAEKSNLEI